LTVITLSVLALLTALFAPYYLPYLAHAFPPDKLRLTRELLYLLAPWLIFNGVAQLVTSILNAGEKFALPALVPLATPLVVIGFVTFGVGKLGAFALSTGTVTGSVLEAALLVKLVREHGIRLRLRWGGLDSSVRMVLAQYAPLLAGAFLVASAPVVDQSMAASLSTGSVSALGYANRVVSGIAALGASALSSASLPYFSSMAAAGDWAGCRHTLKRYSVLIGATTVPFTLLLIAFSRPVAKLLYQRGAFTPADTALVSHIQVYYGSTQDVLILLCANLQKKFPRLRIAGASPSTFGCISAEIADHIRDQIRHSGARIVFVGLGCPRQEVWAYEFRERLNLPILAVGAAFPFLAGTLRQAPKWMQDRGLEWLFRLCTEPRRLWRRYLLLSPAYLFLVASQWLGFRFRSEATPPGNEILYG
jgi:exopolysaccharide biosynthesis WecB/TagA/CpsF family protein